MMWSWTNWHVFTGSALGYAVCSRIGVTTHSNINHTTSSAFHTWDLSTVGKDCKSGAYPDWHS